jgi:hypothetical protein
MSQAAKSIGFLLFAMMAAGLSHLAWQTGGRWVFLIVLTIALIALFRHRKPPKFRK